MTKLTPTNTIQIFHLYWLNYRYKIC